MTEPQKSHIDVVLEVVRGGVSPLGDKTWTTESIAKQTSLSSKQVANAISKLRQFARAQNHEPELRRTEKGVYVYAGPLKRGRKKANGVHAAEVPAEDFSDMNLLDMDAQLASEDTVVIVDVAANEGVKPQPTLVEGFAQIGEKFHAAFGDIRVALGVTGVDDAMRSAVEAEKAAVREKAVTVKPNKVSRVRRLMRELELEMRYLENEWDALAEKGRRYDKMTMTMFGFSSNDPAAVDKIATGE
jgi:hypothetical protein